MVGTIIKRNQASCEPAWFLFLQSFCLDGALISKALPMLVYLGQHEGVMRHEGIAKFRSVVGQLDETIDIGGC